MSQEMLARFDRAAELVEATVAAVKPDQLGGPTPCTQWTVRDLMNHIVGGNLFFISLATGGPMSDRGGDHVGDDPGAALRATLTQLRSIFTEPGFAERPVTTPFGPGTGAVLVEMRTNEFVVHSWDLAKATGQSTDLDPELAEWSLRSFQNAPMLAQARGDGGPFGAEQPAPVDGSVADRLAAFVGRAA
jgi:uncharacterized protein (TIGR03086 family)